MHLKKSEWIFFIVWIVAVSWFFLHYHLINL
jgi:hypothetical protein